MERLGARDLPWVMLAERRFMGEATVMEIVGVQQGENAVEFSALIARVVTTVAVAAVEKVQRAARSRYHWIA